MSLLLIFEPVLSMICVSMLLCTLLSHSSLIYTTSLEHYKNLFYQKLRGKAIKYVDHRHSNQNSPPIDLAKNASAMPLRSNLKISATKHFKNVTGSRYLCFDTQHSFCTLIVSIVRELKAL
jgi:hypothetical protein